MFVLVFQKSPAPEMVYIYVRLPFTLPLRSSKPRAGTSKLHWDLQPVGSGGVGCFAQWFRLNAGRDDPSGEMAPSSTVPGKAAVLLVLVVSTGFPMWCAVPTSSAISFLLHLVLI